MACETIPPRQIWICDRCGIRAGGETVEGLKFRHPGGADLCAPCHDEHLQFMRGAPVPALKGRR